MIQKKWNEITEDDVVETLFNKNTLIKLLILLLMIGLFFSAGYIMAKEKAMNDAYSSAIQFVNDNCIEQKKNEYLDLNNLSWVVS